MTQVALDSPWVDPQAEFLPLEGGGARIVTPELPWHSAVSFPIDVDGSRGVFAVVEGRRGVVDVNLTAADGSTSVSNSQTVTKDERRVVFAQSEAAKPQARWLTIRNGNHDGPSECDVRAVFAADVPRVKLSDDEATLALRNPRAARERCVRRAWPQAVLSVFGTQDLPLQVEPPGTPWRMPPPRKLWSGEMERTVLGAAEDLIGLLEEFEPGAVETHVVLLPDDAMRSYLRMNVVRVVRVVEQLRRRGFDQGSVLEVGAWFGSFSLALSRLAYDVVACDRYSSYGSAFEANVRLLERSGVRVVSTEREQELDQISGLGEFDIVLAGAVIEHVPHTPRFLLEALFRAVRPGGVIVIDTPNLTRYWNRRAFERGESIFQPLADQYGIEPPWEGHHREFTAPEMNWMLKTVGCEEVEVEFVDYNMLQFDELSSEHTECLAAIIADPTQSDTLLATGRRAVDNQD